MEEFLTYILIVCLMKGEDKICWRPSRTGKFSVQSYYEALEELGSWVPMAKYMEDKGSA